MRMYGFLKFSLAAAALVLTPLVANAAEPPVRFACLFAGNGFHSREWWARGEGAARDSVRMRQRPVCMQEIRPELGPECPSFC